MELLFARLRMAPPQSGLGKGAYSKGQPCRLRQAFGRRHRADQAVVDRSRAWVGIA